MHKNEPVCLQTDEKYLNIICRPTCDNITLLPIELCVKIIGEQVLCTLGFSQLFQIDKNHYKINVTYPEVLTISPRKLILNKNLDDCSLFFFDGTIQSIIIQSSETTASINLNEKISNPSFSKFCNHFALQGKLKENDYLLVFDRLGNIIFEIYDSEIEITKNQITVMHKLYDISQHGYVVKYTLSDSVIKKTDEYCVYLNNSPIYSQNKHSICMAFLEAINVKNLKLARFYLSYELNDCLNDNQLLNFFGEYEEFEPNFLNDFDNSTFFYYKNDVCKVFKFSVKENKITDITSN